MFYQFKLDINDNIDIDFKEKPQENDDYEDAQDLKVMIKFWNI